MLSKMRKKRSQRGEPLAGRQLRDGRWEALTCSIAGAGPGWTVRRASACRNWGGVGGEARRWVSGWYCPTWGTFRQDPGSPPHPFAGLASPRAHPALPAAIVQVEQESVVPKFLKGLVVVPVHVACGGAINLPSGGGSGGGSRDTEHPPGARPKPRGWGKGLGPPVRCPFGGHGRGGGTRMEPPGPPGPFSSQQPRGGTTAANGAEVMAKARLGGRGRGDGKLSKSDMMAGGDGQRGEEGAAPGTGGAAWVLGSITTGPGSPGAACGSLLASASRARGVQLGSPPWHLSPFGFCLGCTLTAQPFALVFG